MSLHLPAPVIECGQSGYSDVKGEWVMQASPFAAAHAILKEAVSKCVILDQTQQRIDFLAPVSDGTTLKSRLEHLLKEETVVLGIQHPLVFQPWQEYQEFIAVADKCVSDYIERDESALPGYVVPVFGHRVMAIQYILPIKYGDVSNEEYSRRLRQGFDQASKAMNALISVVSVLVSRDGRTPSEKACMRSIYEGCTCTAYEPSAHDASGTPH